MVVRVTLLLPTGGRLVLNSVSPESAQSFREAATQHGCTVARETRIAVDAFHPITVIQAIKQA